MGATGELTSPTSIFVVSSGCDSPTPGAPLMLATSEGKAPERVAALSEHPVQSVWTWRRGPTGPLMEAVPAGGLSRQGSKAEQ